MYDLTVPKHGKAIVKTDIAVAVPAETYARIGKHKYRLLLLI